MDIRMELEKGEIQTTQDPQKTRPKIIEGKQNESYTNREAHNNRSNNNDSYNNNHRNPHWNAGERNHQQNGTHRSRDIRAAQTTARTVTILGDSNTKFLNPDKMTKKFNICIIDTKTTQDASNAIPKCKDSSMVVLHTGTNDLRMYEWMNEV